MAAPVECPTIEVCGAPRERGRQYGEQAAARIRLGVQHYTDQIRKKNVSQAVIEETALGFESQVAAFDANYVEEMHGIAEGAGVNFASVMLLNARTELLKLAGKTKASRELHDECTGLVVLPKASKEGTLIHAQNWDWKTECVDTAVVLKIRNEDGPDIITFTEAGVLARFGFNTAGISITGNYLECERDYRRLGVPLALIRRKVLEQDLLGRAMHAVYTTPKSASNNIIVTQSEGIAIDFECVPDETFMIQPQDGLIVHANHFQSPVALSKLTDTGIANMPDSLYRDTRVRESLEPHVGQITVDHVKTALFDDYQSPWSVCRPPRPSFSGNNQSVTVAMIVMQPAKAIMDVALLPALHRNFTRYTLAPKDVAGSTRSAA